MSQERIPGPVWALVSATAVVALGYGLISPVLPRFAASFSVSVTAASVIVSIFAFFRLAFAPVGGALLPRLGERWTYMLGLAIVAASSLATAFASDYVQLLVFRGLGGIGSTFFTVSAAALLIRLSPPNLRGRVSSAYAGAFLLGNLCGPVLGGALAAWGLHVPFIAYAAMLVVAICVMWVRLPARLVPQVAPGAAGAPMRFAEAIKAPAYRAALSANFANGWTNLGARVALTPLLVAALIGEDPLVAGVVLTAFTCGNALAISFSGRLADVRGRRPMVLLGLAVAGCATLGLGWVTSLPVMLLASGVAGFGGGLAGPAQQATVADVVGLERGGGQVLAAFQMLGDLGAIIGPIATAALIDRAGFGWGFVLSGGVLLVSLIPWLLARDPSQGAAGSAA